MPGRAGEFGDESGIATGWCVQMPPPTPTAATRARRICSRRRATSAASRQLTPFSRISDTPESRRYSVRLPGPCWFVNGNMGWKRVGRFKAADGQEPPARQRVDWSLQRTVERPTRVVGASERSHTFRLLRLSKRSRGLHGVGGLRAVRHPEVTYGQTE